VTNCQICAKLSFIYSNYIQIKLDFDFIMTLTVLPLSSVAENVDTEKDLLECVCLLLQDLLQSCAREERRIVEDMCYEIRRAEACVDWLTTTHQ
jgi:hypothetical protein